MLRSMSDDVTPEALTEDDQIAALIACAEGIEGSSGR